MAINNWWENDPAEKYWMEIRSDPKGLGEYLLAPKRNATGGDYWSYTLTSYVQPGDRIFHWHEVKGVGPALIAWSDAGGPLETVDWSWQARGSFGRARGVPTSGEAWRVPLTNFTLLDEPITRAMVTERRAAIRATQAEIEATAGKPIYFPFIKYGDAEVRSQQGYLSKLPAALLEVLFGDVSVSTVGRRPLVQPPRVGRKQGYLADAQMRGAVERHAVELAKAHYDAMGATRIEERGKPFDLLVVIKGVERHVEVKGSTGIGIDSVQLTQGEVDHAQRYQPTDLFVVDGIAMTPNSDGTYVASGGQMRTWSDWRPHEGALRPTHLRYALPHHE